MKKSKKRRHESDSTTSTCKKKKLLILDLNKVLVYRANLSSCYEIRPYTHEFLVGMSEIFELAIWTSMKKKSCRNMIHSLFGKAHDPNNLNVVEQSESLATLNVPLLFKWYQPKCTRVATESLSSIFMSNSVKNDNMNSNNNDKRDFIFTKNLRDVWNIYPEFNEFNTVFLNVYIIISTLYPLSYRACCVILVFHFNLSLYSP